MTAIHQHYEQLLDHERAFVDRIFSAREMWSAAKIHYVPLAGDDRIERAVDALARAVIESRDPVVLRDIAAGRVPHIALEHHPRLGQAGIRV